MRLVAVPRPAALRLITRARDAVTPEPPFGLRVWSDEADAIAVLLDDETAPLDDPAAIAVQIPHARERPPGTAIIVLPRLAKDRRWLGRWLGPRTPVVPRVARCTALLARGYVALGAGTDPSSGTDIAWGSTLSFDGRRALRGSRID